MERRVDEPDDDRQAVHRPEDALEVALLEDLELGHRGVEDRDGLGLVGGRASRRRRPSPWPASRRWRRGSRRGRSRAARPRGTCARSGTGRCPGRRSCGPGRPPRACRRWSRPPSGGRSSAQPRIVWSSGWSSNRAETVGSAPTKTSPVEPSRLIQSPSLNGARRSRCAGAGRVVDDELGDSRRRTACRSGGRRPRRGGGAAAGGQDALGDGHAVEVVGRGLDADEDDALAPADPLDGGVGVEDGPPDGRARRGVEALGDPRRAGPGARVELVAQELVDVRRLDPPERLLLRDRCPRRPGRRRSSRPRPRSAWRDRVWSMYSLPRSIVNSRSWTSR